MDADEKLMALKKAYADIILGISKEAAARVMASERKSARYQHELKLAKEEGVRMLLRLKQMMDYQASRAEGTSLNQQSKIEELEAQLHEAEDIVKDLREELENMQAELSRVKNENLQHLNGLAPYPNQRNECRKCHNTIVCTCIACVGNQNLPSIILRGKEAGQYRNGCTHRILACERNLLDRDLCISEDIDELKHQQNVRKQEAGLRVSSNEVEPHDELGSVKPFEKENNTVDSCLEKTTCNNGMYEGMVSLEEVTEAAACLQSPDCKLDFEKAGTPLEATESNSPNTTNGILNQPARERIIKYTFQRKRKRQAISESKVNGSLEKEKKIGNVQNGDLKLEQAKPCLSMESSRESRRLAQVARQLISLSEKKWWH